MPVKKPAIKKKQVSVSKRKKSSAKPVKKTTSAVKKKVKTAPKKKPQVKASPPKKQASKAKAVKKSAVKRKAVIRKKIVRQKKPDAKILDLISPSIKKIEEQDVVQRQIAILRPPPVPEPPEQYGVTKIVFMVRDPEWAFAYWEVAEKTIREIIEAVGEETWNNSRRILRIYDVTNIEFNGLNAFSYFDIEVGSFARSWYIKAPAVDRNFVVDLGAITKENRYILIARSNLISLPRYSVSDVLDEEWATVHYKEVLRMSGGMRPMATMGGSSAFMMDEISRRLLQDFKADSETVSSFGMYDKMADKKQKGFRLDVHTELILYGATEPDAQVTVQDIPVKLSPDGTFSLRYSLPEGLQILPVKAKSADGKHKRKITPVVKRSTE